MANTKKQPAKPNNTGKQKPPVYRPTPKNVSLFDKLDNWFNKKNTFFTFLIFGSCLFFSLILFQARMDLGGDDSAYILKAYDFIHKGIFPTYQGPLYPIVLSLFISVFGIKVILLKVVSVIFNLAALFLLYKAFNKRLPAFIFLPVMLLTAINASINNYASLTYSEAFFMMLQAATLFFFFRLNDRLENTGEGFTLKDTYKDWLLAGFFTFCLSLARNIGFAALLAFIIFFIFRKQYRYALYILCAVLVFQIPLMVLEKVVWHVSSQWKSQAATLMLKDPYSPAKGNETFSGFIVRFFGNCNLYLSKRFFQIIGLRSMDSIDTSSGVTFLFIVFALFASYRAFKSKQAYLLITVLYLGGMIAGSFFALQTRWDQPRIIMVYVPLILFLFLFALYDAMKKAPWIGQSLVFYLIIALVIASTVSTVKASKNNVTVLEKNLHGDIFYGYTTDWVNYLNMSRWCADNLPKESLVAARKAPISFIYTGKEFFPVYKAFSTDPDTVLSYFHKNKVDYVMLASLRLNPNVNNGMFINTLWQMFAPVAKKYPQKLKLIHKEGESEPAYLYQIMQ